MRIVVEQKRDHAILACALSDAGAENKPRFVFYERTVSDFRQAAPENGIKNTESAPKYDLSRKFRKGDKVKLRKSFFGRETTFSHYSEAKFNFDDIYTIEEDEEPQPSLVAVASNDGEYSEEFCFYEIELVTPVEELDPYRVGTGIDSQLLYFNNELFAELEKAEDAKRVCDLLNAEYRKEQQQ